VAFDQAKNNTELIEAAAREAAKHPDLVIKGAKAASNV
jgi:hypothetical protein